jgi:enamine deaminase RidA (YjgF/YER057c/UK114 family)
MRGIDPETNSLVDAPRERVRQIFRNIEAAARHSGFGLDSCVRLTVYVTDMAAYRPLINEIQREFWDDGSFPPRTIVAVAGLNQDDFAEVEATFVRPGGT